MTGVVVAGVLKNALADGSGGDSIDDTGQSELGGYDDVPVGRMTASFGGTARARFSRRQRRKRANDSGIVSFQQRQQRLHRLPTDKLGRFSLAFPRSPQDLPVP